MAHEGAIFHKCERSCFKYAYQYIHFCTMQPSTCIVDCWARRHCQMLAPKDIHNLDYRGQWYVLDLYVAVQIRLLIGICRL